MKIVSEECDGSYYFDIVISPDEFAKIENGEMVQGHFIFKHRQHFIGLYQKNSYKLWDSSPEGEE